MSIRIAALVLSLVAPCFAQATFRQGADVVETRPASGHDIIVDEFHPDRARRADGTLPPLPKPAYGGRVVVQMESMPKSLCYALESSGVIRRLLYELHETLLVRDWDTCEFKPRLCRDWTVDVPGKSFTFRLRDDVRWHDGHRFTARDVAFSLSIYADPNVRCDDKRFAYEGIESVEVVDDLTVRVTYAKPYFMAEASVGDLFLLPSHLYDLTDPDNARYDPDYHARKKAADPKWKPTPEERAAYVNDNPHNRAFVGLGPYRVKEYGADSILATRFDGYFDSGEAGYVDEIRWRSVPDAGAAFRAFLNGDLDFFDMVTTDDWFSSAAESPEFEKRAYKGWHDTAVYWYVGWNCKRPQLADARVRRALAHLFDFDEFRRTFYRGLATQVTGMFSPRSPAYDASIRPYAFDVKAARKLLTEAGWYDRDGDGFVDKDGATLDIEILMQAGNAVGKAFGARFQENLAQVGIRLRATSLDWNALNQRKNSGDFDALALGWAPPYESDPEQMFHSRWGNAEKKGSNFVGFADDETDRLIDAGRAELDAPARAAVWRKLHARLYEMQPYLFAFNPPRKFVMNRALRGFASYALDPNYAIRRWYYAEGTPGTRASLVKAQ